MKITRKKILELSLQFLGIATFALISNLLLFDAIDQEMVRREKQAGHFDPTACIFEKNCR